MPRLSRASSFAFSRLSSLAGMPLSRPSSLTMFDLCRRQFSLCEQVQEIFRHCKAVTLDNNVLAYLVYGYLSTKHMERGRQRFAMNLQGTNLSDEQQGQGLQSTTGDILLPGTLNTQLELCLPRIALAPFVSLPAVVLQHHTCPLSSQPSARTGQSSHQSTKLRESFTVSIAIAWPWTLQSLGCCKV